MRAAWARDLAFLSALEARSGGAVHRARSTAPARDQPPRRSRGFNCCAASDLSVLLALRRGEYQISGLSNRLLQRVLLGKKGGQISRVLKRLRRHGPIKKIGPSDKYSVTALGQRALRTALKRKEHLILPALRTPAPTAETA